MNMFVFNARKPKIKKNKYTKETLIKENDNLLKYLLHTNTSKSTEKETKPAKEYVNKMKNILSI